jgi:hypothetical protein
MRLHRVVGIAFLLLGVLAGAQLWAGEDDIRTAWGQLQKAIKARDPEAIWVLIDGDSQSDANRAAKLVQASYARASDKEKPDLEKKFGLTAKELADMNGKLFIKSNTFHNKYFEIPGSKITGVTLKGDKAKLMTVEDDGDKVTFSLSKQKGAWKFVLPMPKAG